MARAQDPAVFVRGGINPEAGRSLRAQREGHCIGAAVTLGVGGEDLTVRAVQRPQAARVPVGIIAGHEIQQATILEGVKREGARLFR